MTLPDAMWTTRDGKRVLISEMSDSHLTNTIAFLRRRAVHYGIAAAAEMGCYARNAPDGAAMAVEFEVAALAEMDDGELLESLVPEWPALVREAVRRGLTHE